MPLLKPVALLAFFTLSSVLISGCKKEIIIIQEVEKEYSWKELGHFLHQRKVQTNSFSNNDTLYTMGVNTFCAIWENPDEPDSLQAGFTSLYFDYPLDFKMPINANVLAGRSSNSVHFYTPRMPFPDWGVKISMESLDPLFATFDSPYYNLGACFGLNEKNQCLIPYLTYDTASVHNIVKDEPSFYLANLVINNTGLNVDTLSCVKIDKEDDWGGVISIFTTDDHFYVACDKKTVKIGENGDVATSFEGSLFRIFQYHNKLYALSYYNLYVSSDEGLTWAPIQEIDSYLVNISYEIMEGKLIGYSKGQLFHFEIDDTGFTQINELMNDGIEDYQITSISKLGSMVYVTTLSGVFSKSFEDFFTYK